VIVAAMPGGSPWLPSARMGVTLLWGEVVGAGIRCTIRTIGLTSTNTAHDGFILSKQRRRYF
jgi:hypothetical protein